jgi:plasmid maintenance system antidote protein VapI
MARKRQYATLQAWMEATGTNASQLAKMVHITPSHMSKILTRSRRCSIDKAWRLHMITGVPVQNLVKWLSGETRATLERSVKKEAGNAA